MGMCQIHLGDVRGGCRSLRAALKIHPHDASARRLLQRGEQWLRQQAPERPAPAQVWI
jgi:hypothetical protein